MSQRQMSDCGTNSSYSYGSNESVSTSPLPRKLNPRGLAEKPSIASTADHETPVMILRYNSKRRPETLNKPSTKAKNWVINWLRHVVLRKDRDNTRVDIQVNRSSSTPLPSRNNSKSVPPSNFNPWEKWSADWNPFTPQEQVGSKAEQNGCERLMLVDGEAEEKDDDWLVLTDEKCLLLKQLVDSKIAQISVFQPVRHLSLAIDVNKDGEISEGIYWLLKSMRGWLPLETLDVVVTVACEKLPTIIYELLVLPVSKTLSFATANSLFDLSALMQFERTTALVINLLHDDNPKQAYKQLTQLINTRGGVNPSLTFLEINAPFVSNCITTSQLHTFLAPAAVQLSTFTFTSPISVSDRQLQWIPDSVERLTVGSYRSGTGTAGPPCPSVHTLMLTRDIEVLKNITFTSLTHLIVSNTSGTQCLAEPESWSILKNTLRNVPKICYLEINGYGLDQLYEYNLSSADPSNAHITMALTNIPSPIDPTSSSFQLFDEISTSTLILDLTNSTEIEAITGLLKLQPYPIYVSTHGTLSGPPSSPLVIHNHTVNLPNLRLVM